MKKNAVVMGRDNKAYTVADVRVLLLNDDRAVARAIFRIYEYQTQAEQNAEATLMNNNVGFNGPDARLLTSMTKSYIKYGHLTEKQVKYARPRVLKYASQIVKIMASAQ